MQIMNSKDIYDEARAIRQKHVSIQGEENTLWRAYQSLLRTMLCELVLDRKSHLIDYLCEENGISFAAEHFKCFQGVETTYHWSFDLFTLLRGLNALLKGEQSDVEANFDEYSTYLFTANAPGKSTKFLIKKEIKEFLQEIDQNLGRIKGTVLAQAEAQKQETKILPPNSLRPKLTSSQENLDELRKSLKEQEQKMHEWQQRLNDQQRALEIQAQELGKAKELAKEQKKTQEQEWQPLDFQGTGQMQQSSKSSAHMEVFQLAEQKLREFTQTRRADDSRLLDELKKLQSNMQEGLQAIMQTREGIEYAAMQEAISQLLLLHEEMWEILKFHPVDWKKDYKEDYNNLVDSCKELQANIVQALAMLGVEPISSTNVPYDGKYHQAEQSVRVPVPRGAMVKSVLRPGFQYKEKILEKAIVQWQ